MDISKLVIPDSSTKKQNIAQNMRPRDDKQQLNFINVSSTDVEQDATILSAPTRKRKQSAVPTPKRKKPYKTDQQRKEELEAHPLTRRVEPRHVLCGHCHTWVKLRNSTKYCPTPWFIHIEKCSLKTPEQARAWAIKSKRQIIPPSEGGEDLAEREALLNASANKLLDNDELVNDSDMEDEEGEDEDGSEDEDEDDDRPTPPKRSSPSSSTRAAPRDTRPFTRAPTPPWERSSASP